MCYSDLCNEPDPKVFMRREKRKDSFGSGLVPHVIYIIYAYLFISTKKLDDMKELILSLS